MFPTLLLAFTLPLSVALGQKTDDTAILDPVRTIRSTLKTWREMYFAYREEMHLGYCWADYFLDIQRIVNSFSYPRIFGTYNPEESILSKIDDPTTTPYRSTIVSVNDGSEVTKDRRKMEPGRRHNNADSYYTIYDGTLQKWDDVEQKDTRNYDSTYLRTSSYPAARVPNNNTERYSPLTLDDVVPLLRQRVLSYAYERRRSTRSSEKFQTEDRPSFSSLSYSMIKRFEHKGPGPRSYHNARDRSDIMGQNRAAGSRDRRDRGSSIELTELRGLGDAILSALGLRSLQNPGSTVLGTGFNPVVFSMVRLIGMFVRVGRLFVEMIDSTSVLACTKDYLWGKFVQWIDS